MPDEQESRFPAPNLASEYRERARELARRFAVLEGVVGVALVGGLTLGQADRYSDIDLAVYLRHRTLQTWLLGAAPLPEGESLYHGLRLDLTYRDYAEELSRPWTAAERWQIAAAEILYDPEGLLADLFREKAGAPEVERRAQVLAELRAAEEILEQIVPAWLYRGDALAAHHMLNLALRHLLRAVHLVNDRPAPTDRWLLHLATDLPWRPERWDERLAAALTVADAGNVEATRRRQVLTGLLRECWGRVAPVGAADLRPAAAEQARLLREMAAVGRLPLDEFRRRYGERALIQSPAFALLTVERDGGSAEVVFHPDRLEAILAEGLGRFLDRDQRILRHLAAAR
ncbi:MAG: nucleotidyltransferase domain-containing protein [Sphaerobacter sp.]|nr:nucleotidyltransferase domain-containing protein [Sphaerobacter sp.]